MFYLISPEAACLTAYPKDSTLHKIMVQTTACAMVALAMEMDTGPEPKACRRMNGQRDPQGNA